jgi:uncharacterized protein YciI
MRAEEEAAGKISKQPTHRLKPLQRLCQHGVMFVIELIYKADLSEIDANMRAHMAYLKKYYAAGRFLLSGRKVPREGGIILALGDSREEMEAIVKEDPFISRGLSDFRLIEFNQSQRADSIDALLAK